MYTIYTSQQEWRQQRDSINDIFLCRCRQRQQQQQVNVDICITTAQLITAYFSLMHTMYNLTDWSAWMDDGRLGHAALEWEP